MFHKKINFNSIIKFNIAYLIFNICYNIYLESMYFLKILFHFLHFKLFLLYRFSMRTHLPVSDFLQLYFLPPFCPMQSNHLAISIPVEFKILTHKNWVHIKFKFSYMYVKTYISPLWIGNLELIIVLLVDFPSILNLYLWCSFHIHHNKYYCNENSS